MPWCSCPGQNGCAWYQCRSTENETIQVFTPDDKLPVKVKMARNTDGMVYLRGLSDCSRAKFEKFSFRVLGEAGGKLNSVPIGIDFSNAFAILVAAKNDQ
jgi:hypothetical protein